MAGLGSAKANGTDRWVLVNSPPQPNLGASPQFPFGPVTCVTVTFVAALNFQQPLLVF